MRAALQNAGVPMYEGGLREDIARAPFVHDQAKYLNPDGRKTFAFVRHPLEFYQSYWAFRMLGAWVEQGIVDAQCRSNHFETFVCNIIGLFPGWVSDIYQHYLDTPHGTVDMVGKTTTLEEDLVAFLRESGEDFDEAALRATPRKNVSSRRPEWRRLTVYSPTLAARVCEAERVAMERFGFHFPSELLALDLRSVQY